MSPLKIFITTNLAILLLWFFAHAYVNLSLIWLLPSLNFDGRVAQFTGTLMLIIFSFFVSSVVAWVNEMLLTS
jgi:hypothetical protein